MRAMDSIRSAEQRLVWSFWVAAGLAAIGGALPALLGGGSSRLAGEFVPFLIAALAFAGCAVLHDHGRAVNGALYFVAGLALVYGVLSMAALPLELAALGTCPAAPAPCTAGLPRPLTAGENAGMGFASGFAFASLFVGFLGLMIVFRRVNARIQAPRERVIPPVATHRPAEAVDAATPVLAGVGAKSANGSTPASEPAEPELPAHEEPELPELPPHKSEPGTN
jgi:hypothetical protein